MPFESRVDERNRVVLHIGHGALSYEEVVDEVAAYCGSDNCTRHSLWDLRDASLNRITSDEVQQLALRVVEHARKRTGIKDVCVARSGLDYGLCRMFGLLADYDREQFSVFHNGDEALRWIANS